MTESCRQIVERFIDQVFQGRELDALESLCTTDIVYRMPNVVASGHAGIRSVFEKTFRAFPDCRLKLEFCVAEGERVICRMTMRATFSGPFEDIPPTGRKVVLPQVWSFRLSGRKISEIEVTYDTRLFTDSLGAPIFKAQEHGEDQPLTDSSAEGDNAEH